MSKEKIDFRSVDPSMDKARWAEKIRFVAHEAARRRSARKSLWYQLAAWRTPAMAAAAAAAVLLAIGTAFNLVGLPDSDIDTLPAPGEALSAWAAGDEMPATHRILAILGDRNETE